MMADLPQSAHWPTAHSMQCHTAGGVTPFASGLTVSEPVGRPGLGMGAKRSPGYTAVGRIPYPYAYPYPYPCSYSSDEHELPWLGSRRRPGRPLGM